MSRRYPDKKYYDDDRGLPPRPPRSQRNQRNDDNRRERDYPSSRHSSISNYSSSSRNQPDRRNPPPRSDYGGSRNDRRRSRSPPYPRRSNQIINNHQPGGLRSGRLSPLPRERDSERNNPRSGRNSPASSTSSGNRTLAPARTAQPSRAPSQAPSGAPYRAPSPVRAPAPRPAQSTKPKGFSAPKTKNTRNTFHFLELSLLTDAIIHDSHILQDLGKCMDECEREDPKTPWEEQAKGKGFLKWFEEYRSSVTTLRPVVPGANFGNQVMRDHALLAMKDMIKKQLTRRKLFPELYPAPEKDGVDKKDAEGKKDSETKFKPQDPPKPTIDVSTDVICLLRPPPSKRFQYITFAPYHLPTPSFPSNILLTTSGTLTNLAGSHPLTLSSALPVLTGLKRIAFLWDSTSPPNGPGPLPADLAFLYPHNLPSLETIYILHPEIRPRSEWFWVSPECDTFRGGEEQGSEALFVEVREVDLERGEKGSMWEVLGEENGGGNAPGKRDVWGRGGEEVKVSEGVGDALREVKVLEGLYAEAAKGGKGRKQGAKVKLMGCIPIKT